MKQAKLFFVCAISYTVHWAHLHAQQLNVAFHQWAEQSWKENMTEKNSLHSANKQWIDISPYFSIFTTTTTTKIATSVKWTSLLWALMESVVLLWNPLQSTFILKSTRMRLYFTVKTWYFVLFKECILQMWIFIQYKSSPFYLVICYLL